MSIVITTDKAEHLKDLKRIGWAKWISPTEYLGMVILIVKNHLLEC